MWISCAPPYQVLDFSFNTVSEERLNVPKIHTNYNIKRHVNQSLIYGILRHICSTKTCYSSYLVIQSKFQTTSRKYHGVIKLRDPYQTKPSNIYFKRSCTYYIVLHADPKLVCHVLDLGFMKLEIYYARTAHMVVYL